MGKLGGMLSQGRAEHPRPLQKRRAGRAGGRGEGRGQGLKLEDCYIDIGARDEEQASSLVQVGDTAVYDTAVTEVNGRVISPYLDDRIACAILLKAMEQVGACENDLYFVFTVQEEVGTRGAKTAAWSVDPDYGIAVDVTDVPTTLRAPPNTAPASWAAAPPSR